MADLWERIERSTKNVVEKGKEFTEIIQIEREISVQEKEINNFKILIIK